eukprot:751958-Hanusia_phi.AAC.5
MSTKKIYSQALRHHQIFYHGRQGGAGRRKAEIACNAEAEMTLRSRRQESWGGGGGGGGGGGRRRGGWGGPQTPHTLLLDGRDSILARLTDRCWKACSTSWSAPTLKEDEQDMIEEAGITDPPCREQAWSCHPQLAECRACPLLTPHSPDHSRPHSPAHLDSAAAQQRSAGASDIETEHEGQRRRKLACEGERGSARGEGKARAHEGRRAGAQSNSELRLLRGLRRPAATKWQQSLPPATAQSLALHLLAHLTLACDASCAARAVLLSAMISAPGRFTC